VKYYRRRRRNREFAKIDGFQPLGCQFGIYPPTVRPERSVPCFERLVASGKFKMVALVACMPTLITHLNALTRALLRAQDHPTSD
jgi:hypothetical protein